MFQQAAHLVTGKVVNVSDAGSKQGLLVEIGNNTNSGYISELFLVAKPAVGGDLSSIGAWKGHTAEVGYSGNRVSEISIQSDMGRSANKIDAPTLGGCASFIKPTYD